MKKYFSLICLLTILLSGCNQEELLNNQSTTSESRTFTASFDQNESRTYIEEGNLLRWTEGDQISLFIGSTFNNQYQFDGETGDNAGTFSPVSQSAGAGNALNAHYAVYPYASDVEIAKEGVITATLPAVQSYAENSFGLGENTMVAVTKDTDDTFLKFKNVGGYLKLQLYGDDITVKTITLTGNNMEKLSGKATITAIYGEDPTIRMSDNAAETITFDCGEGIKIGTTQETATAFWIVVPPTIFKNGFSITITDNNENEFTKSTLKEIEIERNVIKPMSPFAVEMIPSNQIWYTSDDGKTISLPSYDETTFGANLVSHVYEGGKGIITFDDIVTNIGDGAFTGCNLTNITIPQSATAIESSAFYGCTSLTNIIIPKSVTTIGSSAFENASLARITIPKSVTTIDNNAFKSCVSLETVKIDSESLVLEGSVFSGCSNLKNINLDGVTKIGASAFAGCTSLKEIKIPKNIVSIGQRAFYNCI